MKYGRLKIIKIIKTFKYKSGVKAVIVLCKCLCGNKKEIQLSSLKSGLTKSCGCLNREKTILRSTKHGHATNGISPTYKSWYSMIQRCNNKKNNTYQYYGGRGISVIKRWLNFKNFLLDMGLRPKGKTLDRINNNKGYSKSNCKWATRKEQRINQRPSVKTVFLVYKGKKQSIKDWSKELGIKYITLYNRIKVHKYPTIKALTKKI